MAKLPRKNQKLFGTTAGTGQMATNFGGLAASSPLTTTGALVDPDAIQTLSQYSEGWVAAVLGEFDPAVEDMNSLCYLFAYQLSYLFQAGISEWNTDTIYYGGSIINASGANPSDNGIGIGIVQSLMDTNTSNPLTANSWTMIVSGGAIITKATADSPYTMNGQEGILRANPNSGNMIVNLPALSTVVMGQEYKIKNVNFNGNSVTITPNGVETIDGASSRILTNTTNIVLNAITVKKVSSTEWEIY